MTGKFVGLAAVRCLTLSGAQATGQWDEDERHGPVAPSSRLQDPPDW